MMKRTRTEIFIEVEETIAVLSTDKVHINQNIGNDLHPEEICPQCRQKISGAERDKMAIFGLFE